MGREGEAQSAALKRWTTGGRRELAGPSGWNTHTQTAARRGAAASIGSSVTFGLATSTVALVPLLWLLLLLLLSSSSSVLSQCCCSSDGHG